MHFVLKQLTKSVTKHDLVYKGKKHPTEVHRLLVSALICISYDKHSQTRSIKKSLKKKKKSKKKIVIHTLLTTCCWVSMVGGYGYYYHLLAYLVVAIVSG